MMIAAQTSRDASTSQPRTTFKDNLRCTTDSRFLPGAEKPTGGPSSGGMGVQKSCKTIAAADWCRFPSHRGYTHQGRDFLCIRMAADTPAHLRSLRTGSVAFFGAAIHLLVLDPQTAQRNTAMQELSPPFLGDEEETARAFSPGLAVTVLAKPNRIVFLSPNAQHMMTRVDVNAGTSPRLSVSGFFHKS
jgi:hypothetical protein